MSEVIKEYTLSGKIKRPFYSLVATWVKESWKAMDIDMIRHSFKCCRISNDMNGLEDTLIFNFDRLNKDNLERDIIHDNDNSNDENSDSEESELDNNYYQENEEQHIIHD